MTSRIDRNCLGPKKLLATLNYIYFLLTSSGLLFCIYSTCNNAIGSAGPFEHGVDVDVRFVDSCFNRIEGVALPFNGFAFGEDRGTEDTASDVCTLFKTRAFLVNLGASCHGELWERRVS
jgi:hypothetical protein